MYSLSRRRLFDMLETSAMMLLLLQFAHKFRAFERCIDFGVEFIARIPEED